MLRKDDTFIPKYTGHFAAVTKTATSMSWNNNLSKFALNKCFTFW